MNNIMYASELFAGPLAFLEELDRVVNILPLSAFRVVSAIATMLCRNVTDTHKAISEIIQKLSPYDSVHETMQKENG